MELLRRTEVKEELKRAKRGVLNIQSLAIRSSSHSSSSSECAEGKVYNEKIHFTQTIIQDIDTIGTFAIELLRRSK